MSFQAEIIRFQAGGLEQARVLPGSALAAAGASEFLIDQSAECLAIQTIVSPTLLLVLQLLRCFFAPLPLGGWTVRCCRAEGPPQPLCIRRGHLWVIRGEHYLW